EYFRRAVALDSTYAAAWVGVARMTSRSVGSGSPAARKQAREESEAAVRKALALDDSLAEAHALLGVLRAIALDDTAEWHFRRALALEPDRSRAREWFVDYLMATGRPAQALAEAERAVELDPMSPTGTAELARALAMNGRCDEALARLEAIQAVDPPPLRVAGLRARCLARKGRWDDALAALRPQAARDSTATLALLGYMSARAGRREEAAAIQARLLQRRQSGRIDAIHLAYVPAALGDRDRAFAWLDSAVVEGSLRFAPGLLVDPTDAPFDMLEGDPRLPRYQARLGRQNR
ncbi:MAG TPA: tetratricopeptide repeat protein, partial [Gemmatimonadales bacterium]|nr:tetratricopeptide repeat protein [Gemmatimonadales bacterium]